MLHCHCLIGSNAPGEFSHHAMILQASFLELLCITKLTVKVSEPVVSDIFLLLVTTLILFYSSISCVFMVFTFKMLHICTETMWGQSHSPGGIPLPLPSFTIIEQGLTGMSQFCQTVYVNFRWSSSRWLFLP